MHKHRRRERESVERDGGRHTERERERGPIYQLIHTMPSSHESAHLSKGDPRLANRLPIRMRHEGQSTRAGLPIAHSGLGPWAAHTNLVLASSPFLSCMRRAELGILPATPACLLAARGARRWKRNRIRCCRVCETLGWALGANNPKVYSIVL